jgi:MraZ protein
MLFLSTFQNRIDKKGRLSVPAQFRAVLAAQEFQGIVAYQSPIHACVEACSMSRIAKLYARMEEFDPYSEARDAFVTTMFGESVQLAFDPEGRITLPEALIATAGIKDAATFVGKGEIFEIWEPQAFTDYAKQARAIVQEKRFMMKGAPS